ncbi:MAG TPA: YfhO family protein [Bacteroidia bacterium]|nr:YfhO family protein [Bacteroidia bacterium]
MISSNLRQSLHHLIASVVFLAVTLLYFSPLLEGKKLRQDDISRWKGMSKEIVDFRESKHSEPLWTNSMFGGMPAYQISVLYKANLVQYVDKVFTLWLPDTSAYVFLYFIGFYFLLITLGVDKRIAVLGAFGFGFSSYFFVILEAGHTSKAHAIGYMAPVMAGIIMCYRKKILAGAVIAALALALELYANHLQITYYLMMMILIFIITEIIRTAKEKSWSSFVKASSALAVAVVFAVLCNITNLWATYEYGKYSTRGPSDLTITDAENRTSGLDKDYATEWSYGISESLSLLIPDAKGGFSGVIGNNNKDALQKVEPQFRQMLGGADQYWGDQMFLLGPDYSGAIIILLFFLGVVLVRGQLRWWLLSATILSMMLAWGKNFMPLTDFFLDYVPGYNKFRAVSMTMVIAMFCIPLLAALALDNIFKNPNVIDEMKKKVRWVAGSVIGFVLLVTIFPGITGLQKQDEYDKTFTAIKQNQPDVTDKQISDYLDQLLPQMENVRHAIFRADALRTLLFLLIAAALIWTYFKFKFDKKYFAAGMIVLLLLDMWTVDKRYLNDSKFISKVRAELPFTMTQSDQLIKQIEPTPAYRVLNVSVDAFQDASTSYFHHSIGGYHGAKMKRYKELIDYHLSPAVQSLRQRISRRDSMLTTQLQVHPTLNMLDAKYIIYSEEGGVLRNPKALGNAWFVNEYKIVANADSEITALGNFNPAATAIVDKRFNEQVNGLTPQADSAQTISLTSYEPNDLVYQSKTATEQLAVFSEIYYDKGWNAYVDEKLTPHFRCNYVLRAMRVPAGEHKIEFKFEPVVFGTGEKVSFAASALLLLAVAGIAFMEWKKKTVGS